MEKTVGAVSDFLTGTLAEWKRRVQVEAGKPSALEAALEVPGIDRCCRVFAAGAGEILDNVNGVN